MAKVKKVNKGYDVIHEHTGLKLGHRQTKKEANKLAREIRKRNK